MFADELDKLKLQLKETQELLHAAERAKEEQASLKRLESSRASELETKLAQAGEDMKTAGNKLAAATKAAEGAQVLQLNFNALEDELKATTTKLSSTEKRLAETRKRNEKLEEDLAVASAHLVQNKARYEEASRLLDAFRQREQADLAIGSGKF